MSIDDEVLAILKDIQATQAEMKATLEGIQTTLEGHTHELTILQDAMATMRSKQDKREHVIDVRREMADLRVRVDGRR